MSLFVRRLMAELQRLHRIPKVQVERVVGPVLGMFLPDAIAPCLATLGATTGFEVVAPEFPLRRADGNQSTNIDWLLVHPGLGLVVLLELKTDSGSMSGEQGAIYDAVRDRIEREGAGFLIDDLHAIRDASARREKYAALEDEVLRFETKLRTARRAATVWLVPEGTDVPVGASSLRVHFRDLPGELTGELAECWPLVRDGLIAIERMRPAEAQLQAAGQDGPQFAQHIVENLRRERDVRVPARFWIGATGAGAQPNYQVEFTDGSVHAYRHGGARHAAERFKPGNLDGPFEFAMPLQSPSPMEPVQAADTSTVSLGANTEDD